MQLPRDAYTHTTIFSPHLSWKEFFCFCVLTGSLLQRIKESKQTSYWQPSKAANQCVICNSCIDLHVSNRPTSERSIPPLALCVCVS